MNGSINGRMLVCLFDDDHCRLVLAARHAPRAIAINTPDRRNIIRHWCAMDSGSCAVRLTTTRCGLHLRRRR